MNRKHVFAFFMTLWVIIPVSMAGVLTTNVAAALSPHPLDGGPYDQWDVFINSDAQGQINFTAAEFMALPNVTGWATPQGDVRAKFKGVNFTWFAVTYGAWGGNISAKFIATDGFTATKDNTSIISNATHCHILAYEYDDQLMGNQYQLWLIPICVTPGGDIGFAGNQHPRIINEVQIIGSAAAGESTQRILIFVVTFAGAVSVVGALVIALSVVLQRRKAKGV
ncbi:MAG: hypothetical protein ACXACA_06175 [Candidatus Ranarchaeia archaeon]